MTTDLTLDFCRVKPDPSPEYPLRAIVRTYWAHAVFRSPEDAQNWANAAGDLPRMVTAYLAWVEEQTK